MIAEGKYYGKYEAVVTNNQDPLRLGRIQVRVKGVTGNYPTTWARPCSPWGGFQKGIFAIPPTNASVFVEYLNGDIDKPVWTGCYWETSLESPLKAIAESPGDSITIQTADQTSIQIVENGHIKLQCGLSTVTIKPDSIELLANSIKLNGREIAIEAAQETKIKGSQVKVNGITDVNGGNLKVLV